MKKSYHSIVVPMIVAKAIRRKDAGAAAEEVICVPNVIVSPCGRGVWESGVLIVLDSTLRVNHGYPQI
ncbi:hypothetical protein GCM10017596_04520 [Microbacterium keratanolyticum]|uniref:Uncharacterized protein n=1 Tax=Microbacterium keratanolyticum TaxID=67574 RepID=A0A9W6HQW7_9MICO|nr:hypothetical protein GCM10017596_04520 [Microbacterium keratanolyticum]